MHIFFELATATSDWLMHLWDHLKTVLNVSKKPFLGGKSGKILSLRSYHFLVELL